jgi:polyhydroxyalkanoate synthase
MVCRVRKVHGAFFPIDPSTFEAIKLLEAQRHFIAGASALWNQVARRRRDATPLMRTSIRLADRPVVQIPWPRLTGSNATTLWAAARAVESGHKTRARLRFAVEQWMAASAPSNFHSSMPKRGKGHRPEGEAS